MKRSVAAWGLLGLMVVFSIGSALLPDKNWPLATILFIGTVFMLSGAAGALIAARSGNAIGWILLGFGLSLTSGLLATQYAARTLVVAPESLPGGEVAAWFQTWLWIAIVPLVALLVLLFPTGRLPSRRWAVVAWVSIAAGISSAASTAFRPGPFDTFRHVTNPFGIPALRSVLQLANRADTVALIAIAASVVSVFVRFRRARGIERQQLKWFVSATGAGAVLAATNPALQLFRGSSKLVEILSFVLPVFGFLLLPTAISLAVLRYRLYDIDRILSRSISYAIVTALLAGTFALVVLVPTTIVGSRGTTPSWLVAVATLTAAAVFQPARRRVQNAVDHRFNRARYNAAHTIDEFSARLRDEIDLQSLETELRQLIVRTMAPASVSLWLKP